MRWWKKKKPKPNFERGATLLEDLIECCDGKSNPIKFFSAHQIQQATDNFSKSNHVSEVFEDGYKWYSDKNENYPMILIKRFVRRRYDHGKFCRDIAISSMVSGHKNFMKLVGCCLDFNEPVMVFHGVKKHYQLDISQQTWKRRMKIAEDIATALAYLHTAFPRPFVYRSFSPGNVLLDEDGVAKLIDFSDCVSIPEGETFVKVDRAGTISFMDKKYIRHGVVSEETDVFAIGVLMLMLLIGAKMGETADPEMLEKMGEISEEEICQMKAFLMLSQRCISEVEVPTMVEVAKELKKIQRSLKKDSSSTSGETQFDSAQYISSSVLIGLRGEAPTMVDVANELKKIQRYLKNYYSTPSPSYEEFDSPSPSPSDEEFDSPR